MKLTRILTIAVALAALGLPASTFAKGKEGKNKAPKDPVKAAGAAALNLYDKDSSGSINGDEVAEVRKAFAADKTGPLKALDVNADGTLDDNEIAAIQKGKGKGKGEGKKGKGKKGKGKKGKKDAAEPAPVAPEAAKAQ